MNKPHAHIYSAKINKWIAGTLMLRRTTIMLGIGPHSSWYCHTGPGYPFLAVQYAKLEIFILSWPSLSGHVLGTPSNHHYGKVGTILPGKARIPHFCHLTRFAEGLSGWKNLTPYCRRTLQQFNFWIRLQSTSLILLTNTVCRVWTLTRVNLGKSCLHRLRHGLLFFLH